MKNSVKIKDLPKEQRMQYIMDYYWVHILVVCGILVVGLIFWNSSRSYREPILEAVMINTYKSSEEQSQVLTELMGQLGFESFPGAASADTNIRFGVDETSDAASLNQLMCIATANEGDVFFWTGKEFERYIDQGALADLRSFLPAELLEQHRDVLVYTTLGDTAEPYPCGIRLENNPWAREHGYLNGGAVGIGIAAKNTQTAAALIEYILDQFPA